LFDASLQSVLAQSLRTDRIETQVELARWSSGNALLAGALLAAAGLYVVARLYRREARGQVTPAWRWTMVVVRGAVLILLGVIGLEPVLVNYVHRRLDACAIVLADESASMSLADSYRRPQDAARLAALMDRPPDGGVQRAAIEEALLADTGAGLLRGLSGRNAVRVFSFADQVRAAAALPPRRDQDQAGSAETESPGVRLPDLSPTGPATDVGTAVRGALDAVGAAPVAGIVLLSDGGFNRGESIDPLAAMLRQKHVPLYAVGVGDPAPPVNVSVDDVGAPRTAFKNDPFSVTVRLSGMHLDGQAVEVELLERHDAGQPTRVGSRRVSPDATGAFDPVVFERKIDRPGRVGYVARVAALADEAVQSDNQREVLPEVQVLDDQMKVLIVAGGPSYDYRFLSRLLERDASVDVACWLQSADLEAVRDGNTVLTELPTQAEDLFQYDAILLLDCDPREFDATWGSLLAAFVSDHGGGLLYAAGVKYAGAFFRSSATAACVELLPVAPDPDAEILLNEMGQYQRRAWPMRIPDPAMDDPILRQADRAADNRAAWAAMHGVYWHYPVRRAKPLATVLVQHSNPRMANAFGPHVLLATQFVGAGRTAFLGFESTWRWREHGEVFFERFWIQLIRHLVEGRLLGGRGRGAMMTSRDRFELGESVVITVRALDERFTPLSVPELDVTATAVDAASAGADRVRLLPVPGRDGYYSGRYTPPAAGRFHLSLALPSGDIGSAPSDPAVLQRDISVRQSDIEMQNPAMNPLALKELAESSGGQYLSVDEAKRVIELIPDAGRTLITRERPRPLWDNAYVLSALIALLTFEWILRRKARLL
jgi:hypothetical protein